MIIGAHALVYTKDAEAIRAFFRDTLGFPHVDAGDGWLIFRLPPAEVGVHPDAEGGFSEIHLMCDDVEATVADLKRKGVTFTHPVTDYGYGLCTAFRLPDGSDMGLYQPKHPLAIQATAAARKPRKAAPPKKAKRVAKRGRAAGSRRGAKRGATRGTKGKRR